MSVTSMPSRKFSIDLSISDVADPSVIRIVVDRVAMFLFALISGAIGIIQALVRDSIGHSGEFSLFISTTFALYGITAVLGVMALRRGRVLWAVFTLCHLIVPATIFVFQCWMLIPFSNWRASAISHLEACGAIIGINAYMAALNVITAWEVYGRSIPSPRVAGIYRFSQLGECLIWTGGIFCISLLLSSVRMSRDEFMLQSGVGDRFLLRLGFTSGMFLFALSQRAVNPKIKWLGFSLFAVGMFTTIMGFRFFLFTLALTIVVTRAILTAPSLRMIGLFTIFAPVGYLLLIVSAFTRQAGMSPVAALAALLSGNEPLESVLEYAGGNEQCTFYTFVFVEGKHFFSFGEYYGITLLRMLPNGLYTQLSDSLMLSIGHYIAQACAPKWFLDNGLTLGGYFYTEAYVNFGAQGPYLMLLLAYLCSLGMERLRNRILVGELLYTMCSCSMFSLVLYGLENYLKPLLLMCVFAAALTFIVMPGSTMETDLQLAEE